MASVSIVILNYNGRNFLEKFLPTVVRYSEGHHIVVADNNSSDGSVSYLQEKYPKIHLIEFSENHGFCGGYNRALEKLQADYFVLLNSDIEVTENWVEPIIQLFEQDEQISAAQPKLLDYHQRDKFEYAGGAGGFMDIYGFPFCRGRIFDSIETDTGQYDDTIEIFWATGACFFVRANLFKKYGGFDESFFAHMEEIDLCWRMKSDGHKIYHCSKSVVYHVGGGTLAYHNPRKTYFNFRNSLLVLIKNLPMKSLVWKLIVRWAIDYVAIAKFIVTGQFKDALMVLKAHLYVWKNFNSTKGKKLHAQKHLVGTGQYQGFLLFQYYFKRVKKFKELHF